MSQPAVPGAPGRALATYRRPFSIDGIACEVVLTSRLTGLYSNLQINGETVATDFTPGAGEEAVRNHRLAALLPDGSAINVEAGYINWVTTGIRVNRDGLLVHESHPGRAIAFPQRAARMVVKAKSADGSMLPEGYDPGAFKRNRVPIAVDVALGLMFFVVAKLTDLSTAAIVAATAGLALVVAQRFVKVDLIGGLALFGVLMLLISAGFALVFQDDMAVKMRTTIVGLISASLFITDGLLGGKRLGKGMARYLPYSDLDHGRLAIGVGLVGLVMAGLNYGVARLVSTDLWLFYTTFLDILLAIGLFMLAMRYARGGRPAT